MRVVAFILSAAAVTVVAVGTVDCTCCVQPGKKSRVRKNIAKLNANSPEIVSWKKAIQKMKDLSVKNPNDPRGWAAQAKVHGTLQQGFLDCKHNSWEFFPWHRAYLYFFEDICRELSSDPDFALPYWDWSTENKVPDLCWGAGDPLDNLPRKREPGSGRGIKKNQVFTVDEMKEFVGPEVVRRMLNNPDFESFGGGKGKTGGIESTPHNYVHCWVDGDMCSGGSAWDPVFWLHHCNVDRLWSEWSEKHGKNTPSDPNWLATSYSFVDGKKQIKKVTIQETLNTENLSYRYDTAEKAIAVEPGRKFAAFVSLNGTKRSIVDSIAMDFSLNPTAEVRTFVNQVASAPPENAEKRVLRLTIEGVKVPAKHDVNLRVFVNCQKLAKGTPITDPSYVGSISFFGPTHDHEMDKKAKEVTFALNATPAFVKLYGGARRFEKDEPLKVSVLATPRYGRIGETTIQNIDPRQVNLQLLEIKD